jgi:uncharacterized protein YwgA
MEFEKHALILAMIETLAKQGSRTGKTHIIKGLFLAQAAGLLEVPFNFFLYKHGPYSTDIEESIEQMKSYGAAAVEPAFDGYGVLLSASTKAQFVKQQVELTQEKLAAIQKVCEFIRHKNVGDLERLATAAWIRTHEEIADHEEVARRLNQLKPHIPLAEAQTADVEVLSLLKHD